MKNKTTTKFLLALLLATSLSSCKVGRFVYYNFADITDHKVFPARQLDKSEKPFYFDTLAIQKGPKEITLKGKNIPFEDFLEKTETVSFLIIRNDTLLYENYSNKYDRNSIVASFSMAKSITSILIGCAIDDKLIQNVQEPVTNYVPELKEQGFDKVTIEHVLQMTTGLDYNESYVNPFGDAATYYYGRNLRKAISKMELKSEPGKGFKYQSGNTQLLGLILERALKDKSITEYLNEKIWQPLGMEYDASWSLDRKENGLEKTFCCLNARARDFAKIGRLYLNKGNWNGQQIVSESWVEQSTKVDTTNGSAWYYQYQWWFPTKDGDFIAEGILGQFVYVNPDQNMIIVRLGKDTGNTDWSNFFVKLAAAYSTKK
jgi:CubicO group peptidase (beta-lactamase class C family)